MNTKIEQKDETKGNSNLNSTEFEILELVQVRNILKQHRGKKGAGEQN
jgi:hypothetical protein